MAIEPWQQALKESVTSVAQLDALFAADLSSLQAVVERYPCKITPHYLRLIREPGDPIWKQAVPDLAELDDSGQPDPLGEDDQSPLASIIHRYPDRVIFYVAGSCAGYCRFCTRKRKVGHADQAPSFGQLRQGIDYIAAHPQIRDVILSGGDPLVLADPVLEDLLARVRQIPHVEILRIGSRTPVTLPERITDKLCQLLRKYQPLYFNTHFNHPRELTSEAHQACARLADAGIVVSNQTVLLRGVNDQPQILTELFRGLLRMRVRPYYLHQMDLVRGTCHFRTPIATGLELMQSLRGPVSGLASPHYVVDLPGGKGKVPLLPEALDRQEGQLRIKALDGSLVAYPDDPCG